MNLNINQLRNRLENRFTNIQQIDESILRCIRRSNETPFAVYYFDLGQELPSTDELLRDYQDNVIGRHYFEDRKSLQWSNYLYFILNRDRIESDEINRIKTSIENDRRYARKFVITEEDIDSVLDPVVVAPTADAPTGNIMSVWNGILTSADLDHIIHSDESLPARLEFIENQSTIKEERTVTISEIDEEFSYSSFLNTLSLIDYRPIPRQRNFEFGTINLVFGANGSGKTSLFEAIELLYCGRNKRNPKLIEPYEIHATFSNGNELKATDQRDLQLFREYNLKWYGQPEVRTNNLYLSFAQFNFLDTDAAVDLMESATSIEDNLSKLLVGSEASKIWRDIVRVNDAIVSKLKELRPFSDQIKDELEILDNQLKEARNTPQKSDSIKSRLLEMIHLRKWEFSNDKDEKLANSIIETLSEFLSIVRQALNLSWLDSPVTSEGLYNYYQNTENKVSEAEVKLNRLKIVIDSLKKLEIELRETNTALELILEAQRIMDSGLIQNKIQLSETEIKIKLASKQLVGWDVNALKAIKEDDFGISVSNFLKKSKSNRNDAKQKLQKLQEQYAEFSKLKEQSYTLAQELRQIAYRLLEITGNSSECPLCHTQFKPGELEEHINQELENVDEELGQTLLTNLKDCETIFQNAAAIEIKALWLEEFCNRSELKTDISVLEASNEVERVTNDLKRWRDLIDSLSNELNELESQGLTYSRMEKVLDQLGELGYPLPELTRERIEELSLLIKEKIESIRESVTNYKTEELKLHHVMQDSLEMTGELTKEEYKSKLKSLKEQIVETKSLYHKLKNFSSVIQWDESLSLSELAVEVESIRDMAADLQKAIEQENKAKTTIQESIKRKEKLEKQLNDLKFRIEKFESANSTLENLQIEHSLNSAMDVALQENKTAIETIFSQIHYPVDFKGIGSDLNTLIRKKDDEKAKLSQISTGQRAAYALSIFLAQNAQLSKAPPLILIDDPIAHIDDLNSLSFLDYLREIALTGQRQIFFATANDKLAGLIERKFDFLSDAKFCRFDLTNND